MIAVLASRARHARVVLAPGLPLIEAVTKAMAALSWPSATLLILGGPMTRAVYYTSALTPDGPRWIDYGPAHTIPGPAWLVMGSATFGPGLDSRPTIHCHAVLSGSEGCVGGHLSPELCIIGPEGLTAHATSAASAGFRVQRDPASGFDLLTPA
jgi:hypothetical protein